MKKMAKSSKSKKPAAGKAAGKKPAPKRAVAKPRVERADTPGAPEARYTPPPLRTDGWGPFRYPPQ